MGSELTIPLDADDAKQLEEAQRAGGGVDDVLNDANAPKPFVVHSRNLGVPAIDLDCTARALDLLDELEGVYAKALR